MESFPSLSLAVLRVWTAAGRSGISSFHAPQSALWDTCAVDLEAGRLRFAAEAELRVQGAEEKSCILLCPQPWVEFR